LGVERTPRSGDRGAHAKFDTTRNNLAHSRSESGDAADAVSAFETLLADRLRLLGPDHPNTLTTRNNLAQWHGAIDEATAAGGASGSVAD
jgi:hypothetical protein